MLRTITFCAVLLLASVTWAQAPQPATREQAAAVIDFRTWPFPKDAQTPQQRNLAGVSCNVPGKLLDVATGLRQRLVKEGWVELPQGQFTEGYASAVYQKSGFSVSLSVMPGSKSTECTVMLTNHGNVDVAKLPLPEKLEPRFVQSFNGIFFGPDSVEKTREALRSKLLAAGWQPFGETTVSFFVKKNSVRLQVMVSSSPLPGGAATSVNMSTELLSHDYPAPEKATGLQYSDGTGGLLFDIAQPQPEMEKFFREQLAQRGWTATTDKPIKIDFWDHLIFRNKAGELLDVKFTPLEKELRCTIEYQSAETVAKLDQLAKEKAAAAANPAPAPKLAVKLPEGSKLVKQDTARLELSAPTSKGKATVQAWLKKQEADGWKVKTEVDEAVTGSYELTKGDNSLHVLFTDPGFVVPAEITISVSGKVQLEIQK